MNLTGVFLCAQAVGRAMIEKGDGGKIVNIASVAGLHGAPAETVNALPYHATKGGVIALTRDLAWKWARHGINVNAIAPGWFPSDMANFVIGCNPELAGSHPARALRRAGGSQGRGRLPVVARVRLRHRPHARRGRRPVGLKDELSERLGSEVVSLRQLAGGASKEAWAVDLADGRELLVRRASVGVIHRDTLTLEQEFHVLEAAVAAGVRAPRPVLLPRRDRRPRGVRHGARRGRDDRAQARAGSAAGPAARDGRGAGEDPLDRGRRSSCRAAARSSASTTSSTRSASRIRRSSTGWRGYASGSRRHASRRSCTATSASGNLAVTDHLVAVLDWEFAHVGDPVEDVAWPLVRAWRFGADARHLGGVGDVEPYLERYNELTGRDITLDELRVWEVFGNVKWAIGCLTQSRRHLNGQDRSVEYAVLGRMAAEMEYELLDLIERAA